MGSCRGCLFDGRLYGLLRLRGPRASFSTERSNAVVFADAIPRRRTGGVLRGTGGSNRMARRCFTRVRSGRPIRLFGVRELFLSFVSGCTAIRASGVGDVRRVVRG